MMSIDHSANGVDPTSLSDEEEPDLEPTTANGASRSVPSCPILTGTLSKWTNYVYGWQDRFISLKDGTLSYYKSENDIAFGCRGSLSIKRATIKLHEFDECRFDVSVGDCVWYLRADDPDTRNKWVDAIEAYKQYVDSAYGSENSLRRHGSALSLGSISLSSVKKGRNLFEKLSEVRTYKNILCQQIDSLQAHLDTFSKQSLLEEDSNVNSARASSPCDRSTSPVNGVIDANFTTPGSSSALATSTATITTTTTTTNITPNGQTVIEFKGEAITFKETATEILETLTHCIELMQQREETWKRRFEKEVEKRKRLEEQLKVLSSGNVTGKTSKVIIGPDYEEGPHSLIEEEEFFDALDAMLDKHDQQEKEKRMIKQRAKEIGQPSSSLPEKVDHQLWPQVEEITNEQLYYARLEVGEGGEGGWELFAEEGEMRLFKREVEVDGLVCDPLKAVHIVKGVTAHEVCYHFFSPDVRWDWENTLESMKMVEEVNPNTLVFHQIHKRVWPAAQRDAVFWSHIRKVTNTSPATMTAKDGSTLYLRDIWVVCNKSTDIYDIPLGRCVRMKMTVSMTCETYVPSLSPGRTFTRDDLTCKIIYCSTINPGGWAPASVLRALYKREYPKFLKRYTQYVVEAQENKPILF